ncbi:AEC family transporter [Uliginosibacterium sp. H1]|uniref:AEC family transporter n=1 Tax=Uliginosibacterium sp. H1 TaxID=3114757 RepID=UPI002E190C5B|nr:AEC family transporter [Uliginosibacterium sp. H1]
MRTFFELVLVVTPLFALVFVGYGLARWAGWARGLGGPLARFVFNVAMPVMLFHLMSGLSNLPPVDGRLLLAYFGGCLIVFVLGRVVAAKVLKLDGVAGSILALGGVFANTVLLGLPLARLTIGDAALPSVALVLVFNALTLWTLVTVSVEWARHGSFSAAGFAKTAFKVTTNPVVASILLGSAWGFIAGHFGWALPRFIEMPMALLGQAAGPLALVSLGMGLVGYDPRAGWRISLAICALKLIAHPLIVWGLAKLLHLPPVETQVVVLLASMAAGANVYLMSRQFRVLEGPVAASLVLSTGLAAITTPLALMLAMH